MSYASISSHLASGAIVILDGGTGTELQRRGVPMDPVAWCGSASLQNATVLEQIHRDYVAAGADVITANTYASSRLMLGPAGHGDHFEEINRNAISSALRARDASDRDDVLVAGSLSHMCPFVPGSGQPDISAAPSESEMADGFGELAELLRDEGCDLILLEMMYYPERIGLVFEAALETGLPVWAGFSARRGEDGRLLSYAPEREIPFTDLLGVLGEYEVQAAGVMHTQANFVGEAIECVRERYAGPLCAYPDSGHFKMPEWQFEDTISSTDFSGFASKWIEDGVQIVGGCCGLSPEHIATLQVFRDRHAH